MLSSQKAPSLVAAVLLAVMGLLGMHQEQALMVSGTWSSGEDVTSRLAEREATLNLRSEAEALLLSFTRAQMTRFYWGEFASSLDELGLNVGEPLVAHVQRSKNIAMLWLAPRHGEEAYLAIVHLDGSGTRFKRRHCRGNVSQLKQSFS
ncbi:MAG: thymidylate synthase, partial [Cyanobacteriota bacterium]|nr:thymidylate synthase [Cyanobacteriota bacterium]